MSHFAVCDTFKRTYDLKNLKTNKIVIQKICNKKNLRIKIIANIKV